MGGLAQAFGDNVPILYFAGGPGAQPAGRASELLARPHLPVRLGVQRRSSGRPTWWPPSCAAPSTVCAMAGPVPSSSRSQPTSARRRCPRRPSFSYQPPKRHPASAQRRRRRRRRAAAPVGQEAADPVRHGHAPGRGQRRAARARGAHSRCPCTAPCRASRASTSAIRWPWARAAGPRAGTPHRGSRSLTSSWPWARASPAPAMGSRSRTARS